MENSRPRWFKGIRNVGVTLLCLAGLLFLFGAAPIYMVTDALRGHPQGPHGSHPSKFVGLWVRDEAVKYDFIGQAFYLLPDGHFACMTGLTERRWHFDEKRFFVDAVSRCGNCFRGNVTSAYSVTFRGADQMLITNKDSDKKRGIVGTYRRVEVTDDLMSEMKRMGKSADDAKNFKARVVLNAIETADLFQGRENEGG